MTGDIAMLHVTPPQKSLPVVAESALADEAWYAEVNPATLRHTRHPHVFAIGDAGGSPNAKTAAAVRKQALAVALNTLAVLDAEEPRAVCEGYGSCPLIVDRGRVALPEFGYGVALQRSFPNWLNDGIRPTRFGWIFKGPYSDDLLLRDVERARVVGPARDGGGRSRRRDATDVI